MHRSGSACAAWFASLCVYSSSAIGQASSLDTGLLAGAAAGSGVSLLDDLDAPPAFRLNLFVAEWENDAGTHTLFGKEYDRRYTNGLGFELSAIPSERVVERWIAPVDLFGEFDSPRVAVGGMLRHYMITPSEILDPVYNPDDQHYTGLLSFGGFVQRSEGMRFEHAQLDVGYIGQNSGAQALQEFAHSVLPDQGDPTWVAQQASGLGVFATYHRRWKLRWARNAEGDFGLLSGAELDATHAGSPASGGPGFEIIPYAGGRLGNVYTDASFGSIFRVGWPMPSDFGQSRIFDFTDHTRRAADGFSFSLFASAGARVVARNALIEGNILGGDRRQDTKELVGEFQAGVQLEYRGWMVAYSQSIITEEFDGQQGVSRFGTFSFTLNLAY